MTYTLRKDGKKRQTLKVVAGHYTKEEMQYFNKLARDLDYDDLRDYLECNIYDIIYMRIEAEHEDRMK